MILSGGQLVLSDTTPTYARTTFFQPTGLSLTSQFASYGAIYRGQVWVTIVVNKLAKGGARLPLRNYRRISDGERERAPDTPYAKLLRRPNPKHDPFFFWTWTMSTREVYGEALWVKVRGRDGRPAELWPLHPANVWLTRDEDGGLLYNFGQGHTGATPIITYPERDVVHFRSFNPDTTVRGMSVLEPLRQTLVNEDATRRASTAYWANGAKPSMYLSHPGQLTDEAKARLKAGWDAVHSGVDNFGKTAILEEGMGLHEIAVSAVESEYIKSRQMNREEVCAAFDVSPPVVHILDRATFSNITEQNRAQYRDTMPPRLQEYEAAIDLQLKPDFGADDEYAEFDMSEVLRGSPEQEASAYQTKVAAGILQPAEVRRDLNLPFVPGSDRLFINSTNIPIDATSSRTSPTPPAEDDPTNPPALPPAPKPVVAPKSLSVKSARTITERAARRGDLSDVDPEALAAGLGTDEATAVDLLARAKSAGADVAEFCALVWALAAKETA